MLWSVHHIISEKPGAYGQECIEIRCFSDKHNGVTSGVAAPPSPEIEGREENFLHKLLRAFHFCFLCYVQTQKNFACECRYYIYLEVIEYCLGWVHQILGIVPTLYLQHNN